MGNSYYGKLILIILNNKIYLDISLGMVFLKT